MIRKRLHEVAGKRGIRNAYQLQKITGFLVGMAYDLWNKEWKMIALKTLDTLCETLECEPNDLLEFTKDGDT